MRQVYPEYSVSVTHGESGSVFYVMAQESANEADWRTVRATRSREDAEATATRLNFANKVRAASRTL